MEQVDDAFDRFFKGQNNYPKYKSKHHAKQSYSTKETNGNIALDMEKEQVKLPKLGWVKVKFSKKQLQTVEFSQSIGLLETRDFSRERFIVR